MTKTERRLLHVICDDWLPTELRIQALETWDRDFNDCPDPNLYVELRADPSELETLTAELRAEYGL